jgi:hypothetical protein
MQTPKMLEGHPFVENDPKIQLHVAGLQNRAGNEQFVKSTPDERSQSSNHSPLPPVTQPRALRRPPDMMSLNSILDGSTDGHPACQSKDVCLLEGLSCTVVMDTCI